MITVNDILNALAALQAELDVPAVSGRMLTAELGIRRVEGCNTLFRVLAALVAEGRVTWDGERLYPSFSVAQPPSAMQAESEAA